MFRRKYLPLFVFSCIALYNPYNYACAGSSSDGIFTIQRTTFGSIAAQTSDATYLVTHTVGQSITGTSLSTETLELQSGFWRGTVLPVLPGDLNNDGLVDLSDIVYGMHGLTGQSSPALKDADANGNGLIDPAELIHIMRVQAQLTE